MQDIEKDVVEGVAVVGGLYLLYRLFKVILFSVIVYFLVRYTVGWHRAIPALENIFFSIKAILIQLTDSLSAPKGS